MLLLQHVTVWNEMLYTDCILLGHSPFFPPQLISLAIYETKLGKKHCFLSINIVSTFGGWL